MKTIFKFNTMPLNDFTYINILNILNSEDHDYVDTSTWINKLKNQPKISKNIFFAYSFLLLQFTICLIVSSLSRY